ncbi:amine oxidase [copper-containing] 3-like isoform X1 [Lathamus discolor]|uniref:amine oxidase [copper-containing] 3-like isoform X1 n=1 Tax=Lathamus discolor TaxID=678569 RepID=UPI0032B78A28
MRSPMGCSLLRERGLRAQTQPNPAPSGHWGDSAAGNSLCRPAGALSLGSHARENRARAPRSGFSHRTRAGLCAAEQGQGPRRLPAPAPGAGGAGRWPEPGLCGPEPRGAGPSGAVPAGTPRAAAGGRRAGKALRQLHRLGGAAGPGQGRGAAVPGRGGGSSPPRGAGCAVLWGPGRAQRHRVRGGAAAAAGVSPGRDGAQVRGEGAVPPQTRYRVAGSGYYLSPVGLEVLVDHGDLDVSLWQLRRVFYNGQYFASMGDLEEAFVADSLVVVRIQKPRGESVLGSMRPRHQPGPPAPLHYEPQGPRYSVVDNRVTFQGWSITFGMSPSSGPRFFDIRYRGERIVYELSLQEALALYGSNCPGGMSTRYLDGSFGIGRFAYELVRGLDCPYTATYVDRHYLVESDTPKTNQNSLCVFEHDAALPLRRHFSDSQSLYYGGLRKTTLVIRAVSTLINYDYIWDFMFHSSGAVEVRVHATGYISTSFLHGQGTDYGSRVGPHTLGTMHLHHMHYKVDLDVDGQLNSLETQDMGYELVKEPWSAQNTIERLHLRRKRLEREDEAAFLLNAPMPRYVSFASPNSNKWGHPRSYRIQITSFAGEPLPTSSPMERAISWGRYQLAVTRRKEEEPTSTSIYNQNDPWTPTVAFADFINNETITNEDLVAWISVGFLHVPHAEDIPNTVTVGNGVGFLLRPYNYFDEDPSVDSPDGVYFSSEQDPGACGSNPLACPPPACAPHLPPFRYGGFLNLSLAPLPGAL